MSKIDVRVEKRDRITIFGVQGKTNDRTLGKDIQRLSEKFHRITGTEDGSVLPFFVLSKNYDPKTRDSELFVGGIEENNKLDKIVLSEDIYAVITVKPKSEILWGIAVGQAKQYFYTKWLPTSGYRAKNCEYEYHTEKTVGKNPTVDIIFAISELE